MSFLKPPNGFRNSIWRCRIALFFLQRFACLTIRKDITLNCGVDADHVAGPVRSGTLVVYGFHDFYRERHRFYLFLLEFDEQTFAIFTDSLITIIFKHFGPEQNA